MTKQDQIIKAIKKLTPNAHFSVKGEELIWHDENINQPSQSDLETAMVEAVEEEKKTQYQRDRSFAYPNTDDLIVALWEKVMEGRGESADALEVKRQEVKTANPKPE